MVTYKGVQQTKYDSPGGDNIIEDGYIKAVEKVWLDSFTMATLMTTADTLQIATIPANKKITGVEVWFDPITPTTCTINVGISGDADKFIKAGDVVGNTGAALGAANIMHVSMNNPDGIQYVTTAETDIELSIGVTAVTATGGSGLIKTRVSYT